MISNLINLKTNRSKKAKFSILFDSKFVRFCIVVSSLLIILTWGWLVLINKNNNATGC